MPAISLNKASQREVQYLKARPDEYVKNAWAHPNRPQDRYDFRTTDGEKELNYLLNPNSPLRPENWGSINILQWARGCLKTTTLMMILSWALRFYGPQGFEAYMTAPREGQVSEFIGKFREKIQQTALSEFRTKDSIGHQRFEFPRDGAPVYGHFKTDTGWGSGDALRGPHSHMGVIDEFQDLNKPSFDTFRECIDQEVPQVDYFPAIFLIGTPKMENSFFHEMWQKSDQKEWDPEASEWVAQDTADSYGDNNQMAVRGWHIDQPSNPLHDDAKIEQSRDTYSEQKFKNEVLALHYSPEDELLAERHIDAICDPSVDMGKRRRFDDSYVTIGVDWGGGSDRKAADTVLVVLEHVELEDQKWSEIRYVDFLDTDLTKDDEFYRIEQAIEMFDAERVVVDEGYASKRREDLQEGHHTMVEGGYDQLVGARFGNLSDATKVKWKDPSQKKLFTCDKSHMFNSVVDDIKDENILLPAANLSTGGYGDDRAKGTKIYRQLTAPYEKKRETPTGQKKTTITSDSGRNDDFFDALVYAWVAYHSDQIGPTETFVRFGGHNRPGTV